MRKGWFFLLLAGFIHGSTVAQRKDKSNSKTVVSPARPAKPKLVVGIVVDQMRWDFLYRYADRYQANGGIRRLINQGFSCENTLIGYAPTVTACGHAGIYTGSVPAIHGITGNAWYDNQLNRTVYCTEDNSVETVGASTASGKMSPKNLLTTTISDELRLSTNFRSKVIGVAIKDRGAILPAGHNANAAFWYDNKTGNWVTSTFYMNSLPKWVESFNQRKVVDSLYGLGWKTLYNPATYLQSTADEQSYEGKPFGKEQVKMPYDFSGMIGKNYGSIASTPHGNELTLMMAKEALKNESLGEDEFTDLLAVSLSSPDYIGHAFGPNSIEIEDTYLRLDQQLGAFFAYLDQQVGAGQYTVFLSADHGVAHVPGFLKSHKMPGGNLDDNEGIAALNNALASKFKANKLITSLYNYQVSFNKPLMDSMDIDADDLVEEVIEWFQKRSDVARVWDIEETPETTLPQRIREMVSNGYYPVRCGRVMFVLKPGYIDGGKTGTTHGLWNPYDAHIPLLFYGWGIPKGKSNQEVFMHDIAATLAALLHIQMPSGNIGKPILPVLQQ